MLGDENTISYNVEVKKLDDILFNKVEKIDLIKLDVEMHEIEAIEGMMKLITRDSPSILIEILNDHIGCEIQKKINQIKYNFYNIDEVNGFKKVKKLTKSLGYNFLITKNYL